MSTTFDIGVIPLHRHPQMTQYQRVDFAAQEELVEIIPKFRMQRLDCIGGAYGPFITNYQTRVPLWLALLLRQSNSCVITPPTQLTVMYLKDAVEKEEESETNFHSIPEPIFSVGKLLLRFARDDVPDAETVEYLLDQLQGKRSSKILKNMSFLEGSDFPPHALYFTSFTSPEIEHLRATLLPALNHGTGLYDTAANVGGRTLGSSHSSTSSRAPRSRDDAFSTSTTSGPISSSAAGALQQQRKQPQGAGTATVTDYSLGLGTSSAGGGGGRTTTTTTTTTGSYYSGGGGSSYNGGDGSSQITNDDVGGSVFGRHTITTGGGVVHDGSAHEASMDAGGGSQSPPHSLSQQQGAGEGSNNNGSTAAPAVKKRRTMRYR